MATAINIETYGGFRRGRTDLDRLRANRYGQLEILVPTLARDLHFASAADAETDWNVTNPTHPTLYIHSETTPATDYMALYHDATSGYINVASGSLALQVDGTTVVTVASTGVTLSSGNLTVPDDALLGIGTGNTARLSWDTTDANANTLLLQMPAGGAVDVPVLAIGQSIESVDLGLFNGVVDPTVAIFGVGAVATSPRLRVYKARGTIAAPTVVTTGDDLFSIDAYGAVAAGEYVQAARILFEMTGTIATTRGPGVITFQTATDAAPSVLTTVLTLSAAQNATFAGAVTMNGQLVGAQAIVGSAATSMTIRGSDNVAGAAPGMTLADSVAASGSFTLFTHNVADTSELTRLTVAGSGTDVAITTAAAHIIVGAPDAPTSVGTTPGTNASAILTATGGLGGNTTIATTGVGGVGGGYSFTGGAGGTAASAITSGTGGAGGAFIVTSGAGAASAVTGAGNGTGGAGGAITMTTANGGAVTTSTGTNLGGKGGILSLIAGNGGAATAGTDTGGAGGDLILTAGNGGNGDTGGAGGNITLTPGNVGTGGAPVAGLVLIAGGKTLQSSSATEIGISVVNTALIVGSSGSLVAPYLSQTGAAFTDAIGGDVNGAIGINYDNDTGPTSTLEVRSNGAWVSVAVTGYLMQSRVPWMKDSTFLSHPDQVYEDEGSVWIDESKCFICGEKMVPGEQITFWANGPTTRGIHAIFGHQHLEQNEDFQRLDEKLAVLEAENIVLKTRIGQLERETVLT